jgi:hypothetical protein
VADDSDVRDAARVEVALTQDGTVEDLPSGYDGGLARA